jgi:alkylhydroperoxidase/carboxymuconolactone decarboxylase family protein YurZ
MDPLESLRRLDERTYEFVKEAENFALLEGEIPLKYKLLIAMAIDASQGADEGVKVLAELAMKNGATKVEVVEALRIAIYIAGAGAAYTAARGLLSLSDSLME